MVIMDGHGSSVGLDGLQRYLFQIEMVIMDGHGSSVGLDGLQRYYCSWF
jgi:hypothetical protein